MFRSLHKIQYSQAIQTAVFYQTNAYEMFKGNSNMFINLKGSCDKS